MGVTALAAFRLPGEVLGVVLPLADGLGLAAFAATGALAAGRKRMDITGFALLAVVTGVGGGTLRDLLLGVTPVGWVTNPVPVLICLVIAVVTFAAYRPLQALQKPLIWIDAIGLAVFAATGTLAAIGAGASPVIACAMGVITATFGGILRDVLSAEVPLILKREIYVTAALLGAAATAFAASVGLSGGAALAAGTALAFLLRAAAITRGWSLPSGGG
jgi:uncharacterized membrane protein YeiH